VIAFAEPLTEADLSDLVGLRFEPGGTGDAEPGGTGDAEPGGTGDAEPEDAEPADLEPGTPVRRASHAKAPGELARKGWRFSSWSMESPIRRTWALFCVAPSARV